MSRMQNIKIYLNIQNRETYTNQKTMKELFGENYEDLLVPDDLLAPEETPVMQKIYIAEKGALYFSSIWVDFDKEKKERKYLINSFSKVKKHNIVEFKNEKKRNERLYKIYKDSIYLNVKKRAQIIKRKAEFFEKLLAKPEVRLRKLFIE